MLNKDELKSAILEATGHPESGAIVQSLDAMVDLIDARQRPEPVKSKAPEPEETRVVVASETRTEAPSRVIK